MKKLETKIIENTWLPGMDHGWGNGYVMLPQDHKYFGCHYDDIPVEVHGGLTYAEREGDYWVVGFETAHLFDNASDWPQNRVKEETELLREQLETL